mmetsp:Transcript_10836/g.30456  ORF Transcript_10836/g.30456 Transcript_10836/m.30456 type:complete len:240 (+) Transcript_10836:393-1112(+)
MRLFLLEEVVVPFRSVRVGTVPGLLAVPLDIVEDELAAGIGEGAALAGLVVWRGGGAAGVGAGVGAAGVRGRRLTGRGAGSLVGTVIVVVVTVGRGLGTGSGAGDGPIALEEAVPVHLVVELEEGNVLPDGFELSGFGRLGQLPLLVVVRSGGGLVFCGRLLSGSLHLLVGGLLLDGGGGRPPPSDGGRILYMCLIVILLRNYGGLLLGTGGILQVGEEDGGQHDRLAELHCGKLVYSN